MNNTFRNGLVGITLAGASLIAGCGKQAPLYDNLAIDRTHALGSSGIVHEWIVNSDQGPLEARCDVRTPGEDERLTVGFDGEGFSFEAQEVYDLDCKMGVQTVSDRLYGRPLDIVLNPYRDDEENLVVQARIEGGAYNGQTPQDLVYTITHNDVGQDPVTETVRMDARTPFVYPAKERWMVAVEDPLGYEVGRASFGYDE